MSNFDLVLKLFLQLMLILAVYRLMTFVGKRHLRQINVVDEMIVGILLGLLPLGRVAPEVQEKNVFGLMEPNHP